MFLVRCVVASISYIIVIAAWRAGRSQWPIQKIVLQLESLGYRVVLFRVIILLAVLVELPTCDGRTDGHRAMASNKCIAVRNMGSWQHGIVLERGSGNVKLVLAAQWRIQDFCKGGAAAGAFGGVPQAPSCPLSLRPLRKFRGS